jgi:hypothetical protein
MLLPNFSLTQTDDMVIIEIKVPFVRVSNMVRGKANAVTPRNSYCLATRSIILTALNSAFTASRTC